VGCRRALTRRLPRFQLDCAAQHYDQGPGVGIVAGGGNGGVVASQQVS
jgi:hypothetical protein